MNPEFYEFKETWCTRIFKKMNPEFYEFKETLKKIIWKS